MNGNLTQSEVARQNVLNNRYAVEEIQKAIGLKGVLFDGEYCVTKTQIASFLEVSERSITTCTQTNLQELSKNGYAVLTGNSLKKFKLCIVGQDVQEANFPNKTPKIGVYSFRAFLNVAMLLSRSERAKQIRSLILDIVIDTINQRTGGQTKYINQRDEDFVISLLNNVDYHREYVEALTNYIDLGRVKYMIYTNKIYRSIFKEDADEYRRVLRLEAGENERSTMYSEVLDLVASYETGFAAELKRHFVGLGRKLTSNEADEIFARFETMALWVPLREKARQKMASRDLCFRDVLHDKLSGYITGVSSDDFERFIGNDSMSIEERIQGYVEALKRLKNRE
jgi:hypothetical protein